LNWRECEHRAHVFAEENENAPIEDLLGEPHEPAFGAGKPWSRGSVMQQQFAVQFFPKSPILCVKAALQLAITEPLPPDKRQKLGAPGYRDEGVPVKYLAK
jgi:hypothetical protein